MLIFLTGVPGSGKSYFAVNKIFNNFSDSENAKPDLNKNYKNCYTNINEFKFDKFQDVYKLDFDDLKDKLTQLYALYKDKVSDSELIKKCDEFEISNTLFVIDEAHNYFDINDKVLIWWLSYHRHLFQDVFLITQNLALIFSKYKSFAEYFYNAKPTTVVFNRNYLVYDSFISSRLSIKSHSGRIKVKKNKEVFDLYHSGDSVKSDNVILKYIGYAVSFFVLGAILFFIIINNFGNKEDDNLPKQSHIDNKHINNNISNESSFNDTENFNYDEDNIFFILNCTNKICINNDISIPPELVTYFINSSDFKILYTEKITNNYYRFYIDTKSSFYDYLNINKGVNNEKSSSNLNTAKLLSIGK
ncbi:MAG: zonular occludens toxin domain-containing protein [Sulfurimonas sp.]|uniref:zonular occludens toxin domain-containing protein n=1 Tax=Sulfurimonas sp. TaxID=2022749 RepID=UPI002632DBD2|nr:zonular occludens toxin domain-containing protein [Sulfurimonas sp.]MCW8895191.1 zonular occludens toxin domain-containing protein [Sulfurimonas sp.]MCW8954848.1 zonular occludens toxin domain-containing protein [Sulfurimonas sp.]MCW9068443.1 zonular occludens toxin domain-containing protein [Sulfurimonas sp.]